MTFSHLQLTGFRKSSLYMNADFKQVHLLENKSSETPDFILQFMSRNCGFCRILSFFYEDSATFLISAKIKIFAVLFSSHVARTGI